MSWRDIGQREDARSIAGQALFVFAAATLVAACLSWSELPGRSVLIPLVWAFASGLAMGRENSWVANLGLTRSGRLAGLKTYAVSTAVLLPLGVACVALVLRLGFPIPEAQPLTGVTLGEWSLYQFAIVAPFEEIFFRGYLQGRLAQACRETAMSESFIFWVPIGASAFLFGLAHVVVTGGLDGAGVVFPGLLFAWLRSRSGSILAPVLSHGTANVVTRLVLMYAGRA